MSKCIKCGNEILTGDTHWERGLCNNCYKEQDLKEIESCLDCPCPLQSYTKLKQQLAEMNKKAIALFGVLYEILEKEDPDNVSSKIDYLTKQNNSTISDQYKLERILRGGN